MSGARDAMLADIRQALRRRGALDPGVTAALDARTADHPRHTMPACGTGETLADRFAACLEAAGGRLTRVAGRAQVPEAVAAHLRRHQLPARILVDDSDALRGIDWPQGIEVARRLPGREDAVAVTGAFAGVAETGTLALVSGRGRPTTLNFLPDDHLVVLRESQLVAHLEDVWDALRRAMPGMPRTVNLISGPSRTADVEQTIQIGAHGPRRLHVILVSDGATART